MWLYHIHNLPIYFLQKKYLVFVSTYSSRSTLHMVWFKWCNTDFYNSYSKNNQGIFNSVKDKNNCKWNLTVYFFEIKLKFSPKCGKKFFFKKAQHLFILSEPHLLDDLWFIVFEFLVHWSDGMSWLIFPSLCDAFVHKDGRNYQKK